MGSFCNYVAKSLEGLRSYSGGQVKQSNAHFDSGTGRLALDSGGLEICGRDGRLEFSGPEDRLRAGIDEVNIQPVASVLVHAPYPE
jgi:hypothetical protein